MSFGAPTNGSL
jgi:hypothetical protein